MRRRGFTLVELLISVVILGILAALAYPVLMRTGTQGNVAGVRSDLTRLQLAVTDAYQETGGYPASTGAWVTTVAAPTNFTATAGYQVQITTDAGNQGAILQARTSTASVTCSMNVGNRANPGVVTC